MTDVKLIYNPYLLKTELFVKNVAVTSTSTLAFIFGKSMKEWLEPSGAWKGFFSELFEAVGDDKLKIFFIGTEEDFCDLKTENPSPNILLEYILENDSQISPNSKLHSLVDLLSIPFETTAIEEVSYLLTGISNNKPVINVVTTVANFSVKNFLPNIYDNPKLNFVVKNSSQNLMLTLLQSFADVSNIMTLLVFDSKTIYSKKVADNLRTVTKSIGQDEYSHAIYDSLFFVCTDFVNAKDIEDTLINCGFEEPKIFMVNSTYKDCLDTLSASDCQNFINAPISSTLKNTYAKNIARCREVIKNCKHILKFYALYTPEEINDAERRRNEAWNEIALINSNIPAFEQTVLNYFERYALPDTIRKIYFGVKKKLSYAEKDFAEKISDIEESLWNLRNRSTNLNHNFIQENPYNEFLSTANNLYFDNTDFKELCGNLLEKLRTCELPAAEHTFEKNFIGNTDIYLKLTDATTYSQKVNLSLQKNLKSLIDEAENYLRQNFLMPACNAVDKLDDTDKVHFQKLMRTFTEIIDKKNFDIPAVDLDSETFESYESSGKEYTFVQYVPLDQILSKNREQAESILKEQLKKLKISAINFVKDFQTQATEKFNRPTSVQNQNNHELQCIQQAINSKTKSLNDFKRALDDVKKFGERLNRLLEINP